MKNLLKIFKKENTKFDKHSFAKETIILSFVALGCDDCRILLLRRAPAWFPNVKTIQQELSEINKLFDYLKNRNVKKEINYEAIFHWIINEEWSLMRNYIVSIGAEVNHALREEILEFIDELKTTCFLPETFRFEV